MCFIYLDDNTQEVKITADGMTLPEVKILYEKDNTPNKTKFKNVLIYIYYTYNKTGLFHNKLPEERRRITCNTYLNAVDPACFENNALVRSIIDKYIELNYTPTEQLYERLKIDIQDILKKIASIPFEKEIVMEISQDVEVEVEVDGVVIKKTIPVHKKIKVTVDNSKEKLEVIGRSKDLFTQEEFLKKRLAKEEMETGRRIFDIK
jgi:hypothetical protein